MVGVGRAAGAPQGGQRGEDRSGRTARGAGPSWSAGRSGPSQGTEPLLLGADTGQSSYREAGSFCICCCIVLLLREKKINPCPNQLSVPLVTGD